MTRFLGLEFAPLAIPWKRRQQTVGVMIYFYLFFLAPLVSIALIGVLFFLCFPVVFAYGIWFMWDYNRPAKGKQYFMPLLPIVNCLFYCLFKRDQRFPLYFEAQFSGKVNKYDDQLNVFFIIPIKMMILIKILSKLLRNIQMCFIL